MKSKMYRIIIIILYIIPLIGIWQFDYLPMQDYPRHLAGIKVLKDYNNNSFLQENFSIDFFKGFSPIPNIIFELFATKLCFFCDIITTGKFFLSTYIILFILSLYLLSKELKMDYTDVLLMALPVVYSTYLYMGFLNFIFSMPLFLTAIWAYLCGKRKERYLIILGVFSTLLYIAHFFVFASFLVFLFIDLVMSARNISKRFILLTATSVLIPILFSINFLSSSAGVGHHYAEWGEWIRYKITMLAFPFLYFSSGVALFFFYIYALFLIFYGLSVYNKVFFTAAVSYLCLYLFLPFETMEGTLVDTRAIPLIMIMLPFSIRLNENRYKLGIFSLIVLLAIINMSVAWSSFSEFNEGMTNGLSCLKRVEDKSRLLQIGSLRSYPDNIYLAGKPYLHAWGYAFLDKDFITPDFSSKVHHVLRYKKEPYTPPGEWYLTEDKEAPLAEIRENYDYVAIFGKEQMVNSKIEHIGTRICEEGIVTLYRVNKND